MSGLGSFLTGVVKGAETRRQWKRQDRQDEIAEEDRKQRKEHYDYTRERTDRLDAQNAEDRARNNEWQDYQRDITREEQDRADAARAAARDAYAATVAAGEEDPAPATNRGPTMSTSGGQRPRRLTRYDRQRCRAPRCWFHPAPPAIARRAVNGPLRHRGHPALHASRPSRRPCPAPTGSAGASAGNARACAHAHANVFTCRTSCARWCPRAPQCRAKRARASTGPRWPAADRGATF